MTQQKQQLADLYGPVSDDMILVDDLLESIKRVEMAPTKMLDHALATPGKRLRPALVLLAGSFGTYDLNRLVPLGTAIELLHTASLVHDDVVDGAESRRGRPTANTIWDNALTVLLGDFIFSNAAEMVTRTGSLEVTRLFALALMKMTSGELEQDAAAFEVGQDIQRYLWRIGGKTASLFQNSTQCGAMLGECDAETVEALRSYGYNLGMAFQIVDDILDFCGDEEKMGKPVGSDLLEGTITLPALFLIEDSPRDNPVKKFILSKRNRQPLLEAAIDAVLHSEGMVRSRQMAEEFVTRGRTAIAGLPDGPNKQTLHAIGAYVLARES